MKELFENERAEKSVIALIATDDNFRKCVSQLIPSDFSNSDRVKIFSTMQSLFTAGKKIDLVTMSEEMRKLYGEEEAALTDVLIEITTNWTLGAAYAIKDHIEIIKSASMRRAVLRIIDESKHELVEGAEDTGKVLDNIRQKLRDVVVTKHTWKTMQDVMMETYQLLEKKSRGEVLSMPSGMSTLDDVTTGFHKGEVTIIGARPAVGKSAFGTYIAMATAKNGYKVGIVSREMTTEQYGTRVLQSVSDVDPKKLRSGRLDENDWFQVSQNIGIISRYGVSFMFSCRYVEDLRAEVQKKVDSNELDMLVIDYVQLLQTKQKFDKDYLRIAYISKALKDMSTDFNICIVSLAQVGRSSENTMPTLADLRGSGDLEQDADNVIFMHRPTEQNDRYIHPDDVDLFKTLQRDGRQYIALKIAKQRQGETGTVSLVFNPARMQFTAIERNAVP